MGWNEAKAWGEQFVARADLPTWTAICLGVLALLFLVQVVRARRRHAKIVSELAQFRSVDRRISALEYVVNRGMAGQVRQQANPNSAPRPDLVADELGNAPEQRLP